MIAVALAGVALGGTWTMSGAVGHDFSVAEPWAGVALARHPGQGAPVQGIGQLAPAWGFAEGAPYLLGEIGVLARIPEDEAVVRVGVIGAATGLSGGSEAPIALGGGLGISPGLMGALEFEWGDRAPLTFSARGGVGSALYDTCETDEETGCYHWTAAFVGGFGLRYRSPGGLSLEGRLGPSSDLRIGWAFGGRVEP
ncbi:MAG: hypothetical protein JXX28_03975 [Deltaproteobacteria bacterium]|nr:hypothetical protein [Deltaproteobacteria bacterium]